MGRIYVMQPVPRDMFFHRTSYSGNHITKAGVLEETCADKNLENFQEIFVGESIFNFKQYT